MNTISRIAASFDAAPPFDVLQVRDEFPILTQQVRGKRFVFLDSAASTQKAAAGDRGHDRRHANAVRECASRPCTG